MATTTIPNAWLCPITLTLMHDPVIGSDGHTYERAAIHEWLQYNLHSPMTRQLMSITNLTPNLALKHTIEEYLASTPEPKRTATAITTPPFVNGKVTAKARRAAADGRVHVRLTPPETGAGVRQGVVMIAILDNSGSMAEPASMGQGTETHGFSRLDLVKHAVRTMAATLQEIDSLAIVTFSTAARVVIAPTSMNDAGKARINTALEQIQPEESTNMWDGIRVAADMANNPELAGRHIVAMLLTDGFPTINPPRGILPTLKTKLILKNPWTLHTFGFGYNLDSALLADIACWGGGLFGFIPDCSMVGTVCINFLANMMSTVSINTKLEVDGSAGAVPCGQIMYDQPRDYFLPAGTTVIKYGNEVLEIQDAPVEPSIAFYAAFMEVLASALQKAKSGNMLEAQAELANFEVAHGNSCDPNIRSMLRDIKSSQACEGQIGIGITTEYFGKWGEHYVRSYLRAQQLQQCMNFKDPGLQIYGGDLFHTIQDEAERLFVSLPPPKPSNRITSFIHTGAPIATMSIFHNPSNGCFHGDCHIRMADDSKQPLRTIKTGQQVWTPSGPATVDMVVVCGSYARSQPMTQIGSLCITPWHPIRWEGRWEFPANIASYTDRLIQTVYNLVLDSGHIVDVEGVECCTLAHGFDEPVVKHPYFGTELVIEDLMKQLGAEYGRPTFTNLKSIRDPDSGMIMRWVDDRYDLQSNKW